MYSEKTLKVQNVWKFENIQDFATCGFQIPHVCRHSPLHAV